MRGSKPLSERITVSQGSSRHLPRTTRALAALGGATLFTFQAGVRGFTLPMYGREFLLETHKIGGQSLFLVCFTGLFTGMVLALQLSVQLQVFGATSLVAPFVSTSVVRELGPVLTALVVAGRAGAGIAAELAAMVVSEQIDAMRLEGTDIIQKLVTSRLRAALLSLPLLTLIADAVAIGGGLLIAVFSLGVHPILYTLSALEALTLFDLVTGLLKPFCFGGVIAMIGCYAGLHTHRSAAGVGAATTQTVVLCSLLIIITDFVLTKLFVAVGWVAPVR